MRNKESTSVSVSTNTSVELCPPGQLGQKVANCSASILYRHAHLADRMTPHQSISLSL
jgi:hypothetical protein